MRIDSFMAGCGLLNIEEANSEELAAILEENAHAFLKAGGLVSWDFWVGLSSETRAAFVVAGDRLWRERAGMMALGNHSQIAALAMADPEKAKDLAAKDALDKIIGDMSERSAA